MKIEYEETAIENKFLLTSRKTGYFIIDIYVELFNYTYVHIPRFAIDFLYEHALNIVHYQATFQAMASHYADFHDGNFLSLNTKFSYEY